MRDRCLQGVEAIVEWKQRMPEERDENRLDIDGQDCGLRLPRSCRPIGDRAALLPLRDRLRVDAIAPGKAPHALLTMLYRSTDRLCRCGAAVKNLAHSASLDSDDKNAPLNNGIKQLEKAPQN